MATDVPAFGTFQDGWSGPNMTDFMVHDYNAKLAAAQEAREKLTKFERLADRNNEEMMEMIEEMRRTTESLERSARAAKPVEWEKFTVGGTAATQDVVKLNAKDSKGFVVP